MKPFHYPHARKQDLVETIHGINIHSPYRWMEEEDSDEIREFVNEQQKLTESYLKDAPNREQIKDYLQRIANYKRFGCPFKIVNKYYYLGNDGLQNQDTMYVMNELDFKSEQIKVFLNINELSEDGTTSLNTFKFSNDGKYFAYAISEKGSDWLRIRIRNVDTNQDLNEQLDFVRFCMIAWTDDNLGFFYSGYLSENVNHKIFYHRLNTDQSTDIIAIEFPNIPSGLLLGRVLDNVIHIQINEECRDVKWWFARFDLPIKGKLTPKPIIDRIEAEYEPLTNDGDLIYFRTNKDASNFKIARLNLNDLNEINFVDIIPENERMVLNRALCFDNDKLILIYLKDVRPTIEIRQLKDNKLIKEFNLPIGSITKIECDRKDSELFLLFESPLQPGIIYYFNVSTMNQLKVIKEMKLDTFNSSDYTVKQVFFNAKDNLTKIPMFIVHNNNLELNNDNLAYLYAYGGFNIPILPTFDISKLLLIKHFRGIYAIANVRGGGEYGKKWYDSGRLLNKQNCIDDIKQAAEYLINKRYTSNLKLTIEGISNGGTMMQIVSNQRPDLFGCIITRVGVHDLLRYDKFSMGYLWQSDFGNTTSKIHFMNLYKLSALINIPANPSKYPNTLILTADLDNRVVPSHSYKLAASLQDKIGKKFTQLPILLRVDKNAGHCDGKSLDKQIDEITDIFSFIQKTLNLKYYH